MDTKKKRLEQPTTGDYFLSVLIPGWGFLVGLIALAKREFKRGLIMIAISIFQIILVTQIRLASAAENRWEWTKDESMYYAGIVNSSQHMLAQYCFLSSGNCLYAVSFGITCTEDHRYPVLVNSDVGALSIEFVCGAKIGKQNVLVAADFDQINKLIMEGSRIGFVIPMEEDQFKAVRFSLNGSDTTITEMRNAASKAIGPLSEEIL